MDPAHAVAEDAGYSVYFLLFWQSKTKFLKCTNSFTSSYSGYRSVIIKDDLMFFLFVKEGELALKKASNLEPVLMIMLR